LLGFWVSLPSFLPFFLSCFLPLSLWAFERVIFGDVASQSIKRNSWILTAEGESYAVRGSPEFQVFQAVPPEGISRVELEKKLEASVFKIGTGKAMKNKWLESLKGGTLLPKVKGVTDEVKLQLLEIRDGQHVEVPDNAITDLKNRKLIESRTWVGYSLKKGPKYAPKRVKPATDLTREILQRYTFRSPYTFHILDVFFFSAADICSAPLPKSSFSKSCNPLGV
jgi:hypothetical protein